MVQIICNIIKTNVSMYYKLSKIARRVIYKSIYYRRVARTNSYNYTHISCMDDLGRKEVQEFIKSINQDQAPLKRLWSICSAALGDKERINLKQ